MIWINIQMTDDTISTHASLQHRFLELLTEKGKGYKTSIEYSLNLVLLNFIKYSIIK